MLSRGRAGSASGTMNLQAAMLDLDQLVYISTASLRLIHTYVTSVYPPSGVSDVLLCVSVCVLARLQNLKGPYFQPSLSVCLSVCVSVSDRHFYPSTLTDFDETWSQGPFCDLVWPRP